MATPARLLSCEWGCHVDFKGVLLPALGVAIAAVMAILSPSPPPNFSSLVYLPLISLYVPTTEGGGWVGEAFTGPAWPGQAEGVGTRGHPGPSKELASLSLAGPCSLLLPLSQNDRWPPPRKGHCLQSSCVWRRAGGVGRLPERSPLPMQHLGAWTCQQPDFILVTKDTGSFRS